MCLKAPQLCVLNGGKNRWYCFSNAPGKSRSRHSPLPAQKRNFQVHPPGTHQIQTSAAFQSWSCWFFLPCTEHFSFFCEPWEILSKVVLAGRIRNEGLFGAGFKFDNNKWLYTEEIYRGNVNHSNVMVLGTWGIQVLLKTLLLFQGLELRVSN